MKLKQVLFILLIAVFLTETQADNLFSGIWLPGSDSQKLVVGATWPSFVNQWTTFASQGLRLVDLDVYNDANDGSIRYSGVFRAGTDGYALYSGVSWGDFTTHWTNLANQGLRLINIETYLEGGSRKYAGVWRAGSDGYYLWAGVTWSDLEAKWATLNANMRLVDIEVYLDTDNIVKYIGVWREGNDAHALHNSDWTNFVAKWNELAAQGLRLTVFKTYTDGAGATRYVGVWRAGSGGYALWNKVDQENFYGKYTEWQSNNLRLVGLSTSSNTCSSACTNKVVCNCGGYVYYLTGSNVGYSWPVNVVGNEKYIRPSALAATSQIFKLPFSDPAVWRVNGWLYGTNSWHHAIDYTVDGKTSFQVKAAAAGIVEYVGWDNWSGNTIVIKHDSSEGTDTYRTIYMHLRNGPFNDCAKAWTNSIPTLSGSTLTDYSNHLTLTGCTQAVNTRNPNPDHWGTNSQLMAVSVGQSVPQGSVIGYSGQTGPGGSLGGGGTNTNNHLHIFFTRKDPTNNVFYFLDPYGIYGVPSCYPSNIIGSYSSPCVRYPILWQNGYMQYA